MNNADIWGLSHFRRLANDMGGKRMIFSSVTTAINTCEAGILNNCKEK